ncbi:MAG: hypothetical protein ACR2OI_05400, partial [Acidimicrobiia bacterium]
GHVAAEDFHAPFGGADLTGDGAEQGGLAGTVRADDRPPLSLLNEEGYAVDGGDATEPDGDVIDVQDGAQSKASFSSVSSG